MDRRMLTGIKQRAEQAQKAPIAGPCHREVPQRRAAVRAGRYSSAVGGSTFGQVTAPSARDPGAQAAGRLRDIESVTDAALSRLGGQPLLQALLDRVKEILRADTAAVLLLDRPAGQLVATAASGIEDEVRQGVRIPLGTGFAGRVAASREPVILTTVDRTTVRNPLLVDRDIRSLLGVPLLAGGEVIGVLHVGSLSGRPFGQDDAELLQMAADRAALALHFMLAQDDALAAVALQRSLLPAALLPLQPDPPIGTADDPQRQSAAAFIPPGAFLCCFTDGLVERRGHSIDRGIGRLAATLDERIAARHGNTTVPPEEDACAAVMRALVGNDPAPDDIAVLMLSRHHDGTTAAETPRPPGR